MMKKYSVKHPGQRARSFTKKVSAYLYYKEGAIGTVFKNNNTGKKHTKGMVVSKSNPAVADVK